MRQLSFSSANGTFGDRLLQRLRIRRVKKFIPPGAVVCDVGCGQEGVMLNNLRQHISKGYGFDLKVGSNFSDEQVVLAETDLNISIPLPNDSVDIVTSLANLEHLEKPERNLSEIYRILKPGGALLMTVPSTYSKPVLEFLACRLHVIDEPEVMDHKKYYDKQSLTRACQAAGFSTIQHRYFQFGMNNFVHATK